MLPFAYSHRTSGCALEVVGDSICSWCVVTSHDAWFAFQGSSAVFGLMHSRWPVGMVAGLLLAFAMSRGLLMDAIVAHATANSLITAYVLATGKWAVWS